VPGLSPEGIFFALNVCKIVQIISKQSADQLKPCPSIELNR
jgi:hypothetical protein